jgi:Holliday junction resolvase
MRDRGAKAIKIHMTGFMERGTPDIIGSYRGRAFLIETKNETGKLSKIQRVRLKQWKASGAIAVSCRSVGEALSLVCDAEDRRIEKANSPYAD